MKRYNRRKLKAHDRGDDRHSKPVAYEQKQARLQQERERVRARLRQVRQRLADQPTYKELVAARMHLPAYQAVLNRSKPDGEG